MEARQEIIKSNAKDNKIHKAEKQLIGIMVLIISISTIIFLVHTIIEASMNYNSKQAHILSYFTIQSNIIVAVWLLALSIYVLSKKKVMKWSVHPNLSAGITTYILVTGIIYWVVLVPINFKSADNSWLFSSSNIWLHTTTPIISFMLYKYIKLINENNSTSLRLICFYIYPIMYITMAMTYAANSIYLYPMFNPDLLSGWIGVIICIMAIVAIFTGIYILLLKYSPSKNK